MTDKKLFAGLPVSFWTDFSDFSTMFQDAEGTIPVTKAGDPVGLYLDMSGNGNHVKPTGMFYGTDGKRCFLTNNPSDNEHQEQAK